MNDCPVKHSLKYRKVPVSIASDRSKFHRRDGLASPDYHGASIINGNGEEIPITEAMVQNACNSFIQLWEVTQKRQR